MQASLHCKKIESLFMFVDGYLQFSAVFQDFKIFIYLFYYFL
jgi:hypothetical protein